MDKKRKLEPTAVTNDVTTSLVEVQHQKRPRATVLRHQVTAETSLYACTARRYLHTIPELRWEEDKTIAYIKEQVYVKTVQWLTLTLVKIEYLLESRESDTNIKSAEVQVLAGGLVLDLVVGDGDTFVLFRADVDGLPVTEDPIAADQCVSAHPGQSHACGT